MDTIQSPSLKNFNDFATVADYVKHVEDYKEYQELKKAMEKLKAKFVSNNSEPTLVTVDEHMTITDSTDEDPTSIHVTEVVNEEANNDQTYNDDEDSNEIRFIKGNKGAKNPGKLILRSRQQFICNRSIKVRVQLKNGEQI